MSDEPTIQKVLAEAKYYEAQATKLAIDARIASKANGWWAGISETTKILGALVLGAGGIVTAITGAQIAELKKENLDLQIERRKNDLIELEQQLESARLAQEQKLEEAKAQLVNLESALAEAKAQVATGPTNVPSLANAAGQADAARLSLKEVERLNKAATNDVGKVLKRLHVF